MAVAVLCGAAEHEAGNSVISSMPFQRILQPFSLRPAIRRGCRSGLVALAAPLVIGVSPALQAQTTAPAPAPAPAPALGAACPLPETVAATFKDGKCTKVVLSEPQTFVRYYHTDTNKKGRYLTTDRFQLNVDAIRTLALNQDWGNRAERMVMVTVPAGTAVFQGVVAPVTPVSCYPGGGQQTFIENSKDPALVWADGPALTLQPFSCSVP